MRKKSLKSNAEIFSDCRRNFNQDNIRKMVSMVIPSKKIKMKQRNRKNQFESKYYDDSYYLLLKTICN